MQPSWGGARPPPGPPPRASRSRDRSPGGWGHRAAAGSRSSSDRSAGALQAAGAGIAQQDRSAGGPALLDRSGRPWHFGIFIQDVEVAMADHREHQIWVDNLNDRLADHAAIGARLAEEAAALAAAGREHIQSTEAELQHLRDFYDRARRQ